MPMDSTPIDVQHPSAVDAVKTFLFRAICDNRTDAIYALINPNPSFVAGNTRLERYIEQCLLSMQQMFAARDVYRQQIEAITQFLEPLSAVANIDAPAIQATLSRCADAFVEESKAALGDVIKQSVQTSKTFEYNGQTFVLKHPDGTQNAKSFGALMQAYEDDLTARCQDLFGYDDAFFDTRHSLQRLREQIDAEAFHASKAADTFGNNKMAAGERRFSVDLRQRFAGKRRQDNLEKLINDGELNLVNIPEGISASQWVADNIDLTPDALVDISDVADAAPCSFVNVAAQMNHREQFDVLLGFVPNVRDTLNQRQTHGKTTGHWLAAHGRWALLTELVLNHGLDLAVKDNDGTPVYAVKCLGTTLTHEVSAPLGTPFLATNASIVLMMSRLVDASADMFSADDEGRVPYEGMTKYHEKFQVSAWVSQILDNLLTDEEAARRVSRPGVYEYTQADDSSNHSMFLKQVLEILKRDATIIDLLKNASPEPPHLTKVGWLQQLQGVFSRYIGEELHLRQALDVRTRINTLVRVSAAVLRAAHGETDAPLVHALRIEASTIHKQRDDLRSSQLSLELIEASSVEGYARLTPNERLALSRFKGIGKMIPEVEEAKEFEKQNHEHHAAEANARLEEEQRAKEQAEARAREMEARIREMEARAQRLMLWITANPDRLADLEADGHDPRLFQSAPGPVVTERPKSPGEGSSKPPLMKP